MELVNNVIWNPYIKRYIVKDEKRAKEIMLEMKDKHPSRHWRIVKRTIVITDEIVETTVPS